MPLFPGPIELANEQWVRNLSSADKSIRFAPTKEDSDAWKEQIQLQKARNYLSTGVLQQQMQEQRAQLISQGILLNRQNNPPPAQMVNQRAVPRLTIEEINRMSSDDIRKQIEKMGQNQMDDTRSAGMKFLDLIDLPRNSVFNIAFTDEGGVEEAAAGLSIATGVGAAIGGVVGGIGGLFAGGVTAIPAAIGGAKGGAIWGASVYGGTLAAGSVIGSFLDEEDKASIRKESLEADTGMLGLPKVFFSQVLDRLGMEKGVARGILGFAGDVLLDPLSWQTKPISAVWSSSTRVGHVVKMSGAGVKNVRHFSKKLLENGVVDPKTGLIKVADNSPYKQLEQLWNQTIIVGDKLHDISPGIDLAKRTTGAKAALDDIAKLGDKATKKQVKIAQRKLEHAIQQDVLDLSHYTDVMLKPGVKLHDDILKAGEAARGFRKRFEIKSNMGITVPFADWIAPSLRRKTNYRDFLVNIPVGRHGLKGRAYKALGKTDQAFIAAERLKRATRIATIGKQLGQYESVKMVVTTGETKGKALFKKINQLKSIMPDSLRDKIHFKRTAVDLGDETPAHLLGRNKNGIRVDVTNLTEQEARFLKDNGWKFEYSSTSGFNDEKLFKVLKSRDDIQELDYQKQILDYYQEGAFTSPRLERARQRLLDAKTRDESLRESMDLGSEAIPKDIDPVIANELKRVEKEIKKADKEVSTLLTRQGLSERQLEQAITPRTSMILTEVNARRGVYFAGDMLGVYRGPGYLQNLVRGHTAETNKVADQIARVNSEIRNVKQELNRNIDQIINRIEGPAIRGKSNQLAARLNELYAEKNAIIGTDLDISDAAMDAATEAQKAFGFTDEEAEAIAIIMEVSADASKFKTKEEFIEHFFGKIKKGGTPETGSEVLYQTLSKTPAIYQDTGFTQREAIAFLSRSGINVGDEAALTNANHARAQVGLSRAGRLLENVGNKIAETTGGNVRLTAGVRLASNRASRAEGLMNGTIVAKLNGVNNADGVELAAITMAMVAKENGATIFHIDDAGKNTLVTLSGDAINGRNRGRVAKEIKALGLDIDTTTYHIGDNGEIHFILKGGKQKDDLAKINKLGYKNVKTQKGTIKTVEAPLIKIEGATDATEGTRQAAQRYLYGRAKELQGEGRSGIFSVLGNLVENEGLYLKKFPIFETDVEMAIHSIRGLNIVGANKTVTGKNWLQFLQNKPKKGDIRNRTQWNFKDEYSGELKGIPEQHLRWLGVEDYLKANANKNVAAEDILSVIEKNKFQIHIDEYAEGALTAERRQELLSRSKQKASIVNSEQLSIANELEEIMGTKGLYSGVSKGLKNISPDFIKGATHGRYWDTNVSPRFREEQIAEAIKNSMGTPNKEMLEAHLYYKIQKLSEEEKIKTRILLLKGERLSLEADAQAKIKKAIERNEFFSNKVDYSHITETMGENHRLFAVRTTENASQGALSHMRFNMRHDHLPDEPGAIGHFRTSDIWLDVDGATKKYLNIEEIQSDAANMAKEIHSRFINNYAKKYNITISKESPDLKSSLLKSGKLTEVEELLVKSDGYYSERILETVAKMSEKEMSDTGFQSFVHLMPEKPPGVYPGSEIFEKAMIRRILKHAWDDVDSNYGGVTIANGSKLDIIQGGLNFPPHRHDISKFPLRAAIAQRKKELGFAAKDLGIQYRVLHKEGNWVLETQFVDEDMLFSVKKQKEWQATTARKKWVIGATHKDFKLRKDNAYKEASKYALSKGYKKKDLDEVMTFDEAHGHWVVKGKTKKFRRKRLLTSEKLNQESPNNFYSLLVKHVGKARARKILFDSEHGVFGGNKQSVLFGDEMPWTSLESPYFNPGLGRNYDVTLHNNFLSVGREMDGLSVQFSHHTGAPVIFGDDFIEGGNIELYHSWTREAKPWLDLEAPAQKGANVSRAARVDARPISGKGDFPKGYDDSVITKWYSATSHQLNAFPERWKARRLIAEQYSKAMEEHGIRLDATGRVFEEDIQAWHEIVDVIYSATKKQNIPTEIKAGEEFLSLLGFSRPIDKVQKVILGFTKETGKFIEGRGHIMHQTRGGWRRGSIEFATDGRATIRALKNPDLGTFVHEMGHVFRRAMPKDTLLNISKRLGVKDPHNWTEVEEELFAGLFMDYVQRQKAPIPELVEPFEKISGIMKKIYTNNYDKPLNKGLRNDLDQLFGGTAHSVKKADDYRDVNKQIGGVETAKNKIDSEISDGQNDIANFKDKMHSAEEEAEKVLTPLRETLAQRKGSIRHKAGNVLLAADRVIENVAGIGRRHKFAGEAVQSLKHGVENKTAFYVRLLSDEVERESSKFAKKYGMTEDDAHKILLAKIIEKEGDLAGRTGFHPSDAIVNADKEGNIYQVMDKYGGKDRIWHDKTLDDMATKLQKLHKDYGLKEAAMVGGEVDPSWGYMPLRLTDEAEKAAQKQAALQKSAFGAGHKPVSLTHGSQLARATNRHWYPVTDAANAEWVEELSDGSVQGWNYVWSKEVAEAIDAGTMNKLPQDYLAYRLVYLRQHPEKMQPGDIWAYNEQIRKAGGSKEQLIPGEALPGHSAHTRWQVDPHPTSPFELNSPEVRNRFTSLVGADYADAIFETNAMLSVAGRTQNHWRMSAVDDFVHRIMPEMKVLKAEEVQDYIANPRNGVAASTVAGEVVINNITYRRLDEAIRDNKTLGALFGTDAKNMWYPEDVARALDDYVKQITSDKNLTAIGNVFDYVQGIWKGSVLMHPAWTTVNVLGGIIHSVVVGKLTPGDFAEHFLTAKKLAHEFHFGNRRGGFIPGGNGFIFDDTKKYIIGSEELTETEAAKHLVEINAIDGSQVAREMFMLHRTAFGNPNPNAKKNLAEQIRHWATLGKLGAWWFKLNASIDDTFRTTVYLSRRTRGESVETAALAMKRAHFDYGDFTRYEETIGRRVIPFYAWQRNNIALQAKLLFERPGYANSYQKIKHAIEQEGLDKESKVPNFMLPRWLKNQLILQLSNDEGKTKGLVIGNLTPIQELIELGQTIYGGEGFEEMWNYFLSSASPILKTPIEWGMGRQMFNARAIGDEDLGEKTIMQHSIDQIGYYASLKGLSKSYMRDGLEGVLYQLMIRGRFQPLDIDRLQAQISIEKNEEIKLLRRSVNNAIKDGDEERAIRLADRIINTYRIMYFSGLSERVPKVLHGRFTREKIGMQRQGITPPGSNIPEQLPFK